MNRVSDLLVTRVIAITGVATTLAINPWFAYDPINLPKLFVISVGSAVLLAWVIMNLQKVNRSYLPLTFICFMMIVVFVASILSNQAPWYQQLWGTWGRSTGFIAYVCFLIIFFSSLLIGSAISIKLIRVNFERLGYAISFYTLLQLMQLDPINWSQKLMVATLGNLNFMSSFLGLTSISYTCRILLERQNLSSKLFFCSIISLNVCLIAISKSIQGIGVYLSGVTLLVTFFLRRKVSLRFSLTWFASSLSLGMLMVLGTAGIGPLSRLKQDTVIFRLDYWRAGINMIMAHPLNGVGIDSYGDYYREFRTIEAVTRTGPQRVTNTAHNVFLDVASGSGLIAGILLALLMIVTAISIFRALKKDFGNHDFFAFCSIWIGFVVFCLISINQIGVGVWGFVSMGLINGFVINEIVKKPTMLLFNDQSKRVAKLQKKSETEGEMPRNLSRPLGFAVTLFLVGAMTTLTVIPNVADYRFVKAIRSSDLDQALKIIDEIGIQDFHKEQLISALYKQGRAKESLDLALSLVKQNPRQWNAWVAIAANELTSKQLRAEAASVLIELDPQNEAVKRDAQPLLEP